MKFIPDYAQGNEFAQFFNLLYRFGQTGIHMALMFEYPSVIATTPKTYKRVLMDDDKFTLG